MSDAFHGADVDALRQQAVSLYDAAQVLVTCVARTTHALDALAWRGQDAERVREEWRAQHAPALLRVAEALNDAATHLLEEAERQEVASAATGGTAAAPTPPPGGGTWADLKEKVATTGRATLTAAADALGETYNVVLSGSMLAADLHLDDAVPTYRSLNQATNAVMSTAVPAVLDKAFTAATVVSTIDSAATAYTSYRDGDAYKTLDNGVSAVLSAASLAPPLTVAAAGLSASWEVGTTAGTAIYEGMQGTAFGDRFTQRMDASFDVAGAWGMVATPGALVVTAAEEVGIAAEKAWERFTGPADGTLDAPR